MRGVWVALNLLFVRRLLRVVACGMLAAVQCASAATKDEPPANVVEKARTFAVQSGHPVVGPPSDADLVSSAVGFKNWRIYWQLPIEREVLGVYVDQVSRQIMELHGPRGKPGRPSSVSAEDAVARVRAALAGTGVPLGGALNVQTRWHGDQSHHGAHWDVYTVRSVAGYPSSLEAAWGEIDAADGRLETLTSYHPIQRVPPTGPLIPEAVARATALRVYAAHFSRPNPKVALAYNAPCYLAPFPPSRICSLVYFYELYEIDEKNETVGDLAVAVDASTGEVWGVGPVFGGRAPNSTLKSNVPPIPRHLRKMMALRLLARAGTRRWAVELALGEGQPSRPPASGARRWQERVGPWTFELAREDRSRTLWVRDGKGPGTW